MHVVLAVNPTLAAWGQLAAIIICFYILVFVIIAVAFNLVMAFGLAWIREKAELIKMLRPTVTSLNKTTKTLMDGGSPDENENRVITSIAEAPVRLHEVEQKVDEGADKVANGTIEFFARKEQLKAIFKTLFVPESTKPALPPPVAEDEVALRGYRLLPQEEATATSSGIGGRASGVIAPQLKNVPSR